MDGPIEIMCTVIYWQVTNVRAMKLWIALDCCKIQTATIRPRPVERLRDRFRKVLASTLQKPSPKFRRVKAELSELCNRAGRARKPSADFVWSKSEFVDWKLPQ